MSEDSIIEAASYRLPTDRFYDPETHLWVRPERAGRVRCGFDPLGAETSGDLVALSFEPVGTEVERGKAFGSLEAAKFVGPLIAPVSGKITAHNDELLVSPPLVNDEPLAHWLVEFELDSESETAMQSLLRDPEAIREWMEREARKFKQSGMIAE